MSNALKYGLNRRICIGCAKPKKIAEFRNGKGGWSRWCPECREEKGELKAAEKHDAQMQQAVKEKIAALTDRKLDAPHITEVCEEMFKRFGGLEGFCTEWKNQIDICISGERAGTKTALDAFKQIMVLVIKSTEMRGSAPDMADLSDEDLFRVLAQSGRKLKLFGDDDFDPDEMFRGSGDVDDDDGHVESA